MRRWSDITQECFHDSVITWLRVYRTVTGIWRRHRIRTMSRCINLKITSISSVIGRHSTGPESRTTTTILPELSGIDSLIAIKTGLIILTALLRRPAAKTSKVAPHRPYSHYGKNVRFKPEFVPGDYIFPDRRPTNLHRRAPGRWVIFKGEPKRPGPYHVLSAGPKQLKILRQGIENATIIICVKWMTKEADAPDYLLTSTSVTKKTSSQSTEKLPKNKEIY